MPTENPIFFIPVSTGLIFIVVGLVMLIFPPDKINSLYGYRTKNSMKTKETWGFAQKYSSKEMMKLGALLSMTGLLGFIYQPSENTATIIGSGLIILVVIVLIIRVEAAIKRKFKSE
ncbi:SdpI family protein [Bizionia argentinensis JUB59]|uniref:SdpI family protein n=1 Tax=Bizionia argentinensis JUB59 TaxID=1046627 RepID=G2EDP5_9FLAO|nr:SdpI family protein [Bizionia argentinensis]EGV43506.1 SdpI family protein [Bizionia argentinensis JUB59]